MLSPMVRSLVALVLGLVALAAPVRALAAAAAPPTIAILYFDYSGKDDEMALLRKGLAQMLISDLAGSDAVRIVERDRLQEILAELKLAESAKIDPASAAKVGKLLGARYMVLGGYFDLGGTLRIDARVVEVETGKIVNSAGVNGKVDDFLDLEQKLSGKIGEVLATQLKLPEKKHAARVKPPSHLSARTAVLYSRALAEKDRGDKAHARETLAAVVKEQSDFELAKVDLDKLMQ